MKPIYFKIPKTENKAIRVQEEAGKYFYGKLHYHPEYQITLIEKGTGLFYGGTNVVKFEEGDLYFIGQDVPHLIKSSAKYYESDSPGIKGLSIFFSYNSFGESFFEVPELREIRNLLLNAKRVIKLRRNSEFNLEQMMLDMRSATNEGRVIQLLKILSQFNDENYEFLNATGLSPTLNEKGYDRLNKVINYTFSNYATNILVENVAEKANLSKSQFSRYFKERTGKTYVQFLNEVRIENACVLLIKEDLNIEQIGYDVGFQNLSNFNRQFKKVKNSTPSQFRTQFQNERTIL
ncbi:AraC family transcriptional regulator [Christiangramia gaetbulicola]|uniref:AraC family transcriptional regulator n=2 Tax=Christiangramia TaxID=292691 RepID=A0A2T6AIA1_9FLAO|nr:AraC family transcriptional regulator [Christiangramia gaetbulicola]PTX43550.1 AraC family transcriptional regulator [Christiangramia gaetbulicola]